MEHEIALAAMDPDAIPHTRAEQREERREALQLRTLLNEDARAAGFAGVFALRERAMANDLEAVKLWRSESFRTRWTMFEERATRIGIDSIPGDPLTAPPAILTRQIEDPEYGPARIGRWLDRGMGTGLVLGLAAAFFLARRKPEAGNPQVDPLPEPVAEW
jgi:hypothetical protein